MSQTEFQLLQEQIKGVTTLMNAQFLGVNDRLDKINGKVQKHDEAIQQALIERSSNRQKQEDYFREIEDLDDRVSNIEQTSANHLILCPNMPKIRALEDNQLSQKAIKTWVVASIASTGVVMGIIWVILQIYFKTHSL